MLYLRVAPSAAHNRVPEFEPVIGQGDGWDPLVEAEGFVYAHDSHVVVGSQQTVVLVDYGVHDMMDGAAFQNLQRACAEH